MIESSVLVWVIICRALQTLAYIPLNIKLWKGCLISFPHLQLYKYINIIQKGYMETDETQALRAINWQQCGYSTVRLLLLYMKDFLRDFIQ